jgi:hypothetical protein
MQPAGAPHGTPPRWAWPAVLALHLLALWSWREATVLPRPATRTPAALSLRWVPQATHPAGTHAPPAVQRAAAPAAAPRPARAVTRSAAVAPAAHSLQPLPPTKTAPAARQPGHPQAEATESPPAPTIAPSPPGATATSAVPASPPPEADPAALLDSAATRQALRQLARQRPLTELADEAGGVAPPAPDTRLGQAVAQAGKGHCAKGEFKGSGMGLFSLPFWVAALARDDCAQ